MAAHFGTYDYTASCDITAAHQHMAHPACDFAKQVMQVALAGTGVWLSDGATNVLPVAPHRAAPGTALAARARSRRTAAWCTPPGGCIRAHPPLARNRASTRAGTSIPRSCRPATRRSTPSSSRASTRPPSGCRNFVGKAAQATLVGDVFDDAATGQGLLNYFLRAVNCGALSEEEAVRRSGLTLDELRGRSFVAILRGRRA